MPLLRWQATPLRGPLCTDRLKKTSARGSSESPCRAFHRLNFPRDGHGPCADATGSDDFPPKSSGTARSGIDEAMGAVASPTSRGYAVAGATDCPYEPGLPSHQQTYLPAQDVLLRGQITFFLLAGRDGSRRYWQSLTKRELNKQHQRYCVSEKSQVPIPL